MKFGSVCSGIEAASVAWEPLGWEPAWFAEIEAFPSAVLAHHWPKVMNLGDMTKIAEQVANDNVEAPDVLVGGTPCQAFSVAGARQSLDDERGQLSLEYIKLANSIDEKRIEQGKKPSIIVWENVPGVLNTKDNAFGCFLGALAGESRELVPTGGRWSNAGCVFGPQRSIAWRILDAQHFGVAQRRRRVFVVASARKGFNPAKVLLEWDGVRRDSAPCRSTGQETTGSTGIGFASSSFAQYRPVEGDGGTLKASGGDLGGGSENLVVGFGCSPTALDSSKVGTITRSYGSGGADLETKPLLLSGANDNLVNGKVRRLTPTECERLQGFPDGHTLISFRGKPADQCPDSPRYAACGNSMAVPVMAWIGKRIHAHAK